MPNLHDTKIAIADAEKLLQRRYGPGIAATYICSKCHRFSHDHDEGDVRGCTHAPLPATEYAVNLTTQLAQLNHTLTDAVERDGLVLQVALLKTRVEAHNTLIVQHNSYLDRHRRDMKRVAIALLDHADIANDDNTSPDIRAPVVCPMTRTRPRARESSQESFDTGHATTILGKKSEYWDNQLHLASVKAKKLVIRNCIMCAEPHDYVNFELCGIKCCLFCKRRVRAKGGHFSLLCRKAPENEAELRAAFNESEQKA